MVESFFKLALLFWVARVFLYDRTLYLYESFYIYVDTIACGILQYKQRKHDEYSF